MALASQQVEINFSNMNSMEMVLKTNESLTESIKEKAKNFHTIDVRVAMKNLSSVGKVINLAYAGSNGFACSTNILVLLSKYQSMIKNSYVAVGSFTEACLTSLKYHKMGLMLAEKDKIESSIKLLVKCAELANRMADESGKLVEEAKVLCDSGEEALKLAQNDENLTTKQRDEIKEKTKHSKAKQVELEVKTQALFKQIQEKAEEQEKVSKQADKQRGRDFILNLINVIRIVPVSDYDINNSSSLDAKEIEIMKMKRDLQNDELNANAEIARISEELRGLKSNDDTLDASLKSLELVIKAMGKVKMTFEHTRQFWLGQEKQCRALANTTEMECAAVDKEMFIDCLKDSGFGWLTLGKINYLAVEAIREVDKEADNMMGNLPTKLEALEIIKRDGDQLVKCLQNEHSAIKM